MDRKLFGIFSGWQITLMVVTAIVTPGTVYAVATQAVSITDPGTGAKSYVDPGRKLSVFDPIAGYANNPQNFVRIFTKCTNKPGGEPVYTPPAGRSLILKSIHASHEAGAAGSTAYLYFEIGASVVAGFDDVNIAGSADTNFGSGLYIKPNESLRQLCASSGYYSATLVGYLVPVSLVPAASASAEEATQSISAGPSFRMPHY